MIESLLIYYKSQCFYQGNYISPNSLGTVQPSKCLVKHNNIWQYMTNVSQNAQSWPPFLKEILFWVLFMKINPQYRLSFKLLLSNIVCVVCKCLIVIYLKEIYLWTETENRTYYLFH